MISLSKEKSIVICRPGKGNGLQLMDKIVYISKINSTLEDTSNFEKHNENREKPSKTVFLRKMKLRIFCRKQ